MSAIEPVRRSFAILEALSRRPQGTIAALADETGLPRPTVARLLKTLMELGYATQVSRHDGYRLGTRPACVDRPCLKETAPVDGSCCWPPWMARVAKSSRFLPVWSELTRPS